MPRGLGHRRAALSRGLDRTPENVGAAAVATLHLERLCRFLGCGGGEFLALGELPQGGEAKGSIFRPRPP